MLQIGLVPLDTAEVTTDVFAALGLKSFFVAEAKPSDLPIDIDRARE